MWNVFSHQRCIVLHTSTFRVIHTIFFFFVLFSNNCCYLNEIATIWMCRIQIFSAQALFLFCSVAICVGKTVFYFLNAVSNSIWIVIINFAKHCVDTKMFWMSLHSENLLFVLKFTWKKNWRKIHELWIHYFQILLCKHITLFY